MTKNLFVLIVLVFAVTSNAVELPRVKHYSLNIRFLLKDHQIKNSAELTIENTTTHNYNELPFLFYRLISVKEVTINNKPVKFSQNVVCFEDESSMQVNLVKVELPTPLNPKESVIIKFNYEGYILGYPEVMAYVKDKIDEDYSLIREDTNAYPILSYPSFQQCHSVVDDRFTFDIRASVPFGYTVACGGTLNNVETKNDTSTFYISSKVPTWRIDIAVAKFDHLKNEEMKLDVYYLPDFKDGAENVIKAAVQSIDFYSRNFGFIENYQGYTIIQIPEGWGSQAGDLYILQAGAAFNDSTKLDEVYHEIAHTWDIKCDKSVQRTRYFSEAFASYFQALTMSFYTTKEFLYKDMEQSRDIYIKWVNYDKKYFDTPIVDYGKYEMGNLSYTKGAWSLYVLNKLISDETFYKLINTLITEGKIKPINFESFKVIAEKVSGKNLNKFIKEWFYSAESSRLLVDKISIEEIIKRYD